MADIGVLPTRTAIIITSSTGEKGTLPAATARQAGCMSAADKASLDGLVQKMHALEEGAPIVIERPVQVDAVTRREFAEAVARLKSAMGSVLPATASVVSPLIPVDDGLSARVVQLEQVNVTYDARLRALSDAVTGLLDHFERMQAETTARLDEHEEYIPARMEIAKGEAA